VERTYDEVLRSKIGGKWGYIDKNGQGVID